MTDAAPLRVGDLVGKPPSEDAVAEVAARVIAASGSDVGACERCGEHYTVTASGRIADHVCKDREAAIARPAVPVVVELEPPRRVARHWMDER